MENETYARTRDDSDLEIRYGAIEAVPGPRTLEFAGPDGVARGWIVLNAGKEPITWATTQFLYVFCPLARFGNLYVPDWATTSDGLVRYAMVSLTGSRDRPDLELFAPPEPHAGKKYASSGKHTKIYQSGNHRWFPPARFVANFAADCA